MTDIVQELRELADDHLDGANRAVVRRRARLIERMREHLSATFVHYKWTMPTRWECAYCGRQAAELKYLTHVPHCLLAPDPQEPPA